MLIMRKISCTRLAWRNLTHRKARLVASVTGVTFAVVIMFVELGYLNGVYDSQTQVLKVMNADLIMINKQKEALAPKMPFAKKRLVQAMAQPGVQAVYPLYMEEHRALWKNSRDGREYPILVFGFEPHDPVFLIPEVSPIAVRLKEPDTALIDSKSKDLYGVREPGTTGELARRTLRIVGVFPLGPDFRSDGNLFLSDRTFFNCFPPVQGQGTDSARVEFGLIKVATGYEIGAVRDSLQQALPDDVRILTRQELVNQIKNYWRHAQPVGYVFGMGMLIGFLIGVIICYQILYSGIMDRWPQYATLKAIGYSNGFLIAVVLQEALYLAVMSFLPGLLCSLGLYALLEGISGIVMRLTPDRAALLFSFTVLMCTLSGLIAVRKLMRSDPAEVF